MDIETGGRIFEKGAEIQAPIHFFSVILSKSKRDCKTEEERNNLKHEILVKAAKKDEAISKILGDTKEYVFRGFTRSTWIRTKTDPKSIHKAEDRICAVGHEKTVIDESDILMSNNINEALGFAVPIHSHEKGYLIIYDNTDHVFDPNFAYAGVYNQEITPSTNYRDRVVCVISIDINKSITERFIGRIRTLLPAKISFRQKRVNN